VVARFAVPINLQIPEARLVVAVLDAPRLPQPVAQAVRKAPLATEALRVDVRQPSGLVVVLVGLQQAARAIGDAGQASCGIIRVALGFGLAAEVQGVLDKTALAVTLGADARALR